MTALFWLIIALIIIVFTELRYEIIYFLNSLDVLVLFLLLLIAAFWRH